MTSTSERWVSLGEPASAAEAAALQAFRRLLPDDGVTRAWANLTFLDTSGRSAEVDVLLLSPVGLYVVELKGWHGTISGDQQNWQVQFADHLPPRFERNPYLLADGKAKRLAGLLKQTAPRGRQDVVPFVQAVVVLHGRDALVELDGLAASHVLALDGYNVRGLPPERTLSRFLATPPVNPRHQITPRQAEQLAALIAAAGFVPTPKMRMVGRYRLTSAEPIATGKGWQDHLAAHPDVPGLTRRVRLFDLPQGASRSDREELERLAQREFSLTRGIRHAGIEAPVDFVRTDAAPALIFEHDERALPLDAYLNAHAATLSFTSRLALIRQIAEVVAYAHSRRLTHRALAPDRVRITTVDGAPQVRIRDWMTGRRTEASSHQPTLTVLSAGTGDVAGLLDFTQWAYLAPETLRGASDPPPIPLDVYGVGALAYLIVTGQPPAKDMAELQDRVLTGQPLDAAAIRPDLPEPLVQLVRAATSPNELDRPATVAEFLDRLAEVEASTRAVTVAAPTDPLEAVRGTRLADRFEVRARRGRGSTGTALLVDDEVGDHEGVVLKIARDDAAAARLDAEAAVLATLDHPRIVQLLEGPLDVDGRRAILLSDAGRKTLADRLASEGRATIEQLENFGRDLLEAVAYLETAGVFHRDIKPTNLGDAPDRGTRKPRLTLFDFSLAPEPVERLGSGTPGYLDPFLGTGRRRQYDRAAELYAAAVTLFEMAKGELPTWARGDSVPEDASDHVVVLPTMFDPAVGEQLTAFFTRALHPDAAQRYSNAADLGRAWAGVFAHLDRAPGAGDDGESDAARAARDAQAATATLTTPLAESGLSPRVLSALAAREDVATVGELIAIPATRRNSIPGLGERYRRELAARVQEWRAALLPGTTIQPAEELPEGQLGVERIAEGLIPRRSPANTVEVEALGVLLGLERSPSVWPTVQEVAAAVRAPRGEVERALENATRRWVKGRRLAATEELLLEVLRSRQGVAELEELAAALVLALGSTVEGEDRYRVAAGVVRAVVEVDARRDQPRLVVRRVADGAALRAVVVAATDPGVVLHGDTALDLVQALAAAADGLVAERSLVPQAHAVTVLRETLHRARAEAVSAALDDDRLLRLAAAGALRARVSSRGELYPRDLPGTKAVLLALRGSTARMLTRERARARVTGRFPAVVGVPDGPAFVELVEQALPALKWDGERFTQVDLTAGASVTSPTVTDLHTVNVPSADRMLRASLRTRSALTLAVSPGRYLDTAAALAERYGVRVVDGAALVVAALREGAAAHGAEWDAVTGLDAHPEREDLFGILRGLAREVVPPRWEEIAARPEPLLVVNAGPLARYGLTDLLARFFDLARPRPAARWLLVARRPADAVPTLDGYPAPLGPDGWVDVPVGLTEMKGIA